MALHARYTKRRKEWLESLSKTPGIKRDGFGRAGCDCMRLGWTEWVDDMSGERLTVAGHGILKKFMAMPNAGVTGA